MTDFDPVEMAMRNTKLAAELAVAIRERDAARAEAAMHLAACADVQDLMLKASAERDQWKANHDNQVAMKAVLRDRLDLPMNIHPQREAFIATLMRAEAERDEARAERDRARANASELGRQLQALDAHAGRFDRLRKEAAERVSTLTEALQRIANMETSKPGLDPRFYGHAVKIAEDALAAAAQGAR